MYDQLMAAFRLDNTALLIAAALAFAFGYIEYIYSFALVLHEKKAPFPIWMHTFYLAHDASWAVILFWAAATHGWHWFFVGASIALFIWTVFELFNIYMAVTAERQEIWEDYYKADVTLAQALTNVGLQVAGFVCFVNLLIQFMGEGSFLQWVMLTNVVMAVGPGVLWMRHGRQDNSRFGASMGLAIVIVLGTINTFIPGSMWAQVMPEVFGTAWIYTSGVVFTGVALFNLHNLSRLPPKTPLPGQKNPIW